MKDNPKNLTTSLDFSIADFIKLMPGYVYWKDRQGQLLGCNAAQLEIWGLSASEEAEITRLNDEEIMSTGIAKTIEEVFIKTDGKKTIVISEKTPLRDQSNNVVGMLSISLDITERKTSNHAKTEFLASMSNDIKTPLAGIMGLAELLSIHTTEAETRQASKEIIECSQSLLGFFNNYLELSKLEHSHVTIVSELFDLEELLKEVLALFKPTAKTKEIALQLDYDPYIPRPLLGSRPTLYRILQNLLGNAVKFTDQGSIQVKVALGEKSTPHEAIIKIIVQDTGIGIPQHKQQFIFEPMTRLTPSYQGVYEGNGIGLYLAQKFVKALAGEIYLKSEENRGSKFTVIFPLQIPLLNEQEYVEAIQPAPTLETTNTLEVTAGKAQEKTHLPSSTANAPLRILLVEDNAIARKTATHLLATLNHQIDVAENSAEAIALFKPGSYDLIFTDVGLPDMDGYKLTEHLRNMESEAKVDPMPIVALTAHDSMNISNKATASGIDAILTKPLSLEKVSQTINRFIYHQEILLDCFIEPNAATEKERNRFTKKVIDLEDGAKILGEEDRVAAQRMLADLVNSLPETRIEIEQAYRSNNAEELFETIHKFYGGLCYVGTPYLRQAAKELESSLGKQEKYQLNRLYQRLLDEMSAVEKEFKAYS